MRAYREDCGRGLRARAYREDRLRAAAAFDKAVGGESCLDANWQLRVPHAHHQRIKSLAHVDGIGTLPMLEDGLRGRDSHQQPLVVSSQ